MKATIVFVPGEASGDGRPAVVRAAPPPLRVGAGVLAFLVAEVLARRRGQRGGRRGLEHP